ncbi:9517_t:CDS:2, partial [Paraglomus occultum]
MHSCHVVLLPAVQVLEIVIVAVPNRERKDAPCHQEIRKEHEGVDRPQLAIKTGIVIEKEENQRELLEKQSLVEFSAYSNADNPFGDDNLGQQFEWIKKKERDKKLGISPEEAKRRERERHEETRLELEKLNKRRAEREVEQQLREEEL